MLKTDGTIKIGTEIDQSGMITGMKKFSGMAKTGLEMTKKLAASATFALAGVEAGLSAAGTIGIKYNASMEQYMASFETLLGDVDAAQKHVQNLKDFASSTPFEISGLADASRTLLSFGVENENVMGILKQLGDVSLGNSEKFSSLALVYGQVASQGKLMGQDLLQCINAGFNPLQVISEHTGQSMAELKEQMSEGAVSAEMVAQAFAWATEEGGMFHDGMQKQSQTFDGQISTLKDNAQALLGEVVEPISRSMTETLLPSAIETIEKMAEAYEKEGLQGLTDASGEAFGDIVSEAAAYAPKMIQVSVEFIKSFGRGIKNNRSKIKKAVMEFTSTVGNELLVLLPESLKEPVKEAIEEIERSFKEGGLKEVIGYAGELLEDFADISIKLTKTVLPSFAKAVDFLAGNMETLVPLTVAYFTAMKSYTVVQKGATVIGALAKTYRTTMAVLNEYTAAMAANGVMTSVSSRAGLLLASTMSISELAVGVLTGKVSLATAAQLAWNAAMNANPAGILITLTAALAGGIAYLALKTDEASGKTDILKDSNDALAESYSGIGEAASAFEEGIASAGTIFDQFNDAILVSSEKQQELADQMDDVQRQITAITGTYVDERRELTESEIQELDRLFEKLHEQASQELEAQQAYQTAVEERARLLAETHQGTAEEYAASSQTIINTAQKTREQVIAKAEEQFNEELALLQLRLKNDETYTQAMYETEAKAAQETYDNAVQTATRQCGDTLSVLTEGYAQRADALSQANEEAAALREAELLENENYNIRKEELEQQLNDLQYQYSAEATQARYDAVQELQELEEDHRGKITDIHEKLSKSMASEAQNQAGTLLDMAANVELYGGKIQNNTNEMVTGVIDELDSLPPEAKQIAVDTMQGMIDGLASKEGALYDKAVQIAENVISKMERAMDIHSPSKKTRALFQYVMAGSILGLEDKEQDLYKKAEEISGRVLSAFEISADTSEWVEKMNAAIASRRFALQSDLAAVSSDISSDQDQIRGCKEFADILADSMSEALEGKAFKVGEREFARLITEVG